MPRADAPTAVLEVSPGAASAGAGAGAAPSPPAAVTDTVLRGWGGGPGVPVSRISVRTAHEAADVLAAVRLRPASRPGIIPRGMGRAYNDAAQRRGGAVLDMTGLQAFSLDPEAGVLEAEAGVTLGTLLDALVPRGFTVPVLPGTQHVSVGGAVASDIHGKNHGVAGSFGSHVDALGLLTADGELRTLTSDGPEPELFRATVGGMGLTGAVVWARVRLTPVSTPYLSVDTDRVDDLDGALAALRAEGGPHRVAWLDLLGPRAGRGVVTRAEALSADALAGVDPAPTGTAAPTVPARATVPPGFPGALLRPESIRAFNALRFRVAPRHARSHIEPIGRHMFPLDGLSAWPRLYGAAGFLQYQFVVPYGHEDVLDRVLERLRASRVPCYLAVLKDFGPSGPGPLSFPMPGWTLAMDMPRAADGLESLLRGFDALVAAAGGRVYLAKDARIEADALAAMYPRLDEWRAVRDAADPEGVWCSDMALRTGLVAAR